MPPLAHTSLTFDAHKHNDGFASIQAALILYANWLNGFLKRQAMTSSYVANGFTDYYFH